MTDALELVHRRRLLPLANMAHHLQRHVRRLLHRRHRPVLLLEFLRRLQREFDRRLIGPQQQQRSIHTTDGDDDNTTRTSNGDPSKMNSSVSTNGVDTDSQPPSPLSPLRHRERLGGTTRHVPTLWQQLVRAALHTMQFAVAYIVMLLAMYYNGYIIVCIFLGVFVGSMVFAWDGLGVTSL